MPRRKKSPGKPVQPAEFGSGAAIIDNYMDSIRKDLESINLPKKLKDKLVGDLARSLVVKAGPKSGSYNADRALELGDLDEMPGVQLEVNLNPYDLLSDPKGWLEKLAKGTVQSVFNTADYATLQEQKNVWQKLVGPNVDDKVGPLIDWGIQPEIKGHPQAKETKPFQLQGLGLLTNKQEVVLTGAAEGSNIGKTTEATSSQQDLFYATSTKFLDFTSSSKTSGTRDTAFRGFANQAGQAIASELHQLDVAKTFDEPQKAVVENVTDKASLIRLANAVGGRADFAKYQYGKKQDNSPERMWNGIGMGPELLFGEIDKCILGVGKDRKNDSGVLVENQFFYNLQNVTERTKGSLIKAKNGLDEIKTRWGPGRANEFNALTASTYKTLKRYLGDNYDGTSGVFKELEAELGGIVAKTEKVGDKTELVSVSINRQPALQNIRGKLDIIHKDFTAEGLIKSPLAAINTRFIEGLVTDTDLHELIESCPQIVGTKNTLNVAAKALTTYKTESFLDVITKLEKDPISIVTDYLLVRGVSRLEGFTPAKFVTRSLQENHYFGLMYNPAYGREDDFEGELYGKGSKVINGLMEKGPLKELFANKHKLKVEIDGVSRSINVVGSHNLRFGLDEFRKTFMNSQNQTIEFGIEGFIDRLNVNAAHPTTKFQFNDYTYVPGYDQGFDDILNRAAGLRLWIKKYGSDLGITFDSNGLIINNPENQKIIEGLFKSLHARDLDKKLFGTLFSSKIGLLENAAFKLTQFQNKLFGIGFKVGGRHISIVRLFAPGTYAKQAITQKVGAWVRAQLVSSKAVAATMRNLAAKALASKTLSASITWLLHTLGMAAAGATEGLSTLVWWIVERVILYAVNKTIKFSEKLIRALRDVDLSIISDFVDGSVSWVFKLSAIITVVVALALFPTTMTMGTIVASIAVVDPTRSSFISDVASTPGGLPGGPASLCNVGRGGGKGKDCFNMTGSWPTQQRDVIQYALNYLVNNFGSFTNKLCAAGDISVDWDPGYADCGRVRSANEIAFGGNHCYLYDVNNENSVNQFIWLVTHELAHAYDLQLDGKLYDWGGNKNVDIEVSFAEAQENDCGQTTLKTYRGGSGTQCSTQSPAYEDWAETIANYVAIHRDCDANIPGCDTFWTDRWTSTGCSYTNRLEWLENNIFN